MVLLLFREFVLVLTVPGCEFLLPIIELPVLTILSLESNRNLECGCAELRVLLCIKDT